MTLEEKAKEFDASLERAKKLRETCDSTAVIGWCEYLFPELKESEDEKIRKELIAVINDLVLPDEQRTRFLSWLEKQGEQKSAGWSKEDDYNLQCMIAKAVKDIQNGNVGRNQELIDWLKSLKQRMQ